ncbi:MAG: mercury methylation corrinoid protein HgcA [Pirellulaceae bacterium]
MKKDCCCNKPANRPATCGPDPNRLAGGAASFQASASWVIGRVQTAVGEVPQVGTSLGWADRIGGGKVRWGIGRMRYRVPPGLYAVGNPNEDSPVLVTANYKLTFDQLRSQLAGRDIWLVVLDTKGVNVWCAAAKGTFGTDEVVRRVEATRVSELVSHNVLVLPQLSAVGVCAWEVLKRTGFRPVFGPVYATDLPAFLDVGVKTPDMRSVHFSLRDRLAVVPVELVQAAGKLLMVAVCFFLLAGLGSDGYSPGQLLSVGLPSAVVFLATSLGTLVLGPALLPYLPGQPFSLKGLWLGLLFSVALVAGTSFAAVGIGGRLDLAAWCLMIPALASFLLMNFTGCTTFTSLSGVRREMRTAVPIQIIVAVVGVGTWLAGRFV